MPDTSAARQQRDITTLTAILHGLVVVTPLQVTAPAAVPGLIRLTLPVGSRAGKPGLAELAAEVAAELRLPTRAGGSLRGALKRIGAALEVNVAANATSFEITFPPPRWREVLSLLGTHLAQSMDPNGPVDVFDTLRLRLATRVGQAWSSAPLNAMVERMRGGRTQSLSEVIGQINLRTASEVAVFQRARYRAAGAVLVLWVPGVSGAELGLGVDSNLPPWLDKQSTAAAMPFVMPLPITPGVYWAPRDGPVDVAVLIPQPTLDQPLGVEMLVLHECLTHDGLGGRLGTAIEELVGRDVSFDLLPAGETDQVVLFARAQDNVVVPLYEALSQVLNSFRLRPPSEVEVRQGAARARLRLLEQIARPPDWLRAVSRLAYRRVQPDAFAKALERLSTPGQLDINSALPLFAKSALALAVVGGQPPVDSSRLVQLITEVPMQAQGVERILPPEEVETQVAAANKLLERAVEALGGAVLLGELRGYRESVVSDTGIGPSVATETAVRWGDRMKQTTRVMATSIETRIDNEGGLEVSGSQQIAIAVDEARTRLAEAARHPAAVLARWQQGQIAFRQLALRMAGDRELAVLEEVTDRRDGVRLSIDTVSNLVRVIEVRIWQADAGALTVRDEFADYRTVKGRLRVPFLRTRTIDDREPAQRTRTLEFDPANPSDDDLR